MQEGGYGFHEVWANLVTFVKEFDVEAIRKKSGIKL